MVDMKTLKTKNEQCNSKKITNWTNLEIAKKKIINRYED